MTTSPVMILATLTDLFHTLRSELTQVTSPTGILAVLAGVTAFFFFLEKRTQWKLFNVFPPLLFIYATPLLLSNINVILPCCAMGVIPSGSPVYKLMSDLLLPMVLILMLLDIDIVAAVRGTGKGVLVMLAGTAGVVLGAPIAYFLVKNQLDPESWKAFGILAGSWIGGTGNMAAMQLGLKASDADFGLAVLGDNFVYIIWLPILIGSKNVAGWFHRVARVDPKRLERLERSSENLPTDKGKPEMRHLLYLIFFGLFFPWLAGYLATWLPVKEPVLSESMWRILLITTFGILLSMTPAQKIPGSRELAVALVYLFVAKMGASANLAGLAEKGPWFVLASYIWILAHGVCCFVAAWVLRVDIHSMAIASAANIGGIASAPIVANHHNPKLVPMSILMALVGYAIGNYAALAAAWLCCHVPVH